MLNAIAKQRYVLTCNENLISYVSYSNIDAYIKLIDMRSKLHNYGVLIRNIYLEKFSHIRPSLEVMEDN